MYTDHGFETRAREQQEAAKREAAEQARKTTLAAEAAEREAASLVEARARAVPDSLFADAPEIKALRARYEVAQRQRPLVSLACPEPMNRAMDDLNARMKAGALEVTIAAIEDVLTGDASLKRALPLQRALDADAARLQVLMNAKERVIRHGLAALMREREQAAHMALSDALLERKLQHLREHPEPLDRARGEANKSEQEVASVATEVIKGQQAITSPAPAADGGRPNPEVLQGERSEQRSAADIVEV